MQKPNNELSTYVSKDDILFRIKEIAAELSKSFCDEIPVFIGILNGSFIFLADLIRLVNFEC